MFVGLCWLLLLWGTQVMVMLLLRHGNLVPRRWLACFILATGLGMVSSFATMRIFQQMNANLGLGLGVGISFLFGQLALFIASRARLSRSQLSGIVLMTVGLFLLAGGR